MNVLEASNVLGYTYGQADRRDTKGSKRPPNHSTSFLEPFGKLMPPLAFRIIIMQLLGIRRQLEHWPPHKK